MRIEFNNDLVSIKSSNKLIVNKENNSVVYTSQMDREKMIELSSKNLKIFVNDSVDIIELFSNCENVSYSLIVDENCIVNNTMILRENNCRIDKKVEVLRGVTLNEILVDLNKNESNILLNIDLNGDNIDCYNRVACIASGTVKNYDVRVNHNTPSSKSKLDNHGVATLNGELYFKATGTIAKNSIKSSVLQNNKIILFDKESKGNIEPLLLIDNNDVNASHAAAVGKVDDNQIFYMCSRGIDVVNAKKMIALGYLTPVLEYINDEDVKEEIKKEIERM